jgi:hypothetical protein
MEQLRVHYEILIMGAATGAIEGHKLFGLPCDLDSIAATVAETIFPTIPADARAKMQLEICDMIAPMCEDDPKPPGFLN